MVLRGKDQLSGAGGLLKEKAVIAKEGSLSSIVEVSFVPAV